RWSGEGLGLQTVELGLVDRARIQQLLGPGDLLGRGRSGVTGSGDRSNIAVELLLGLLLAGRGSLGHPLAPGEQVDQRGQEGRKTRNSTHRVLVTPDSEWSRNRSPRMWNRTMIQRNRKKNHSSDQKMSANETSATIMASSLAV